jgi:aspartate 1-decarboxylase
VTGAEKEYEGSLTLGVDIMLDADLHEYERVEVNARDHDARIVTYVIPGKPGQVELNGGAAQFFKVGDKIHINCFAFRDTLDFHIPKIINL